MQIFDFHVRLTGAPDAWRRLCDTLAGSGIARAAVAAGGVVNLDQLSDQILNGGSVRHDADNDVVLAGCRRAAGRLVPFYFGNPHRGIADYRRQVEAFRGLELSPAVHGLGFADPRVLKLVEIASEAGHPVYTVSLGRPGMSTSDLVELARRFPATWFVLGHCGSIGIDARSLAVIAEQPNLLAETSGCFSVIVKLALSRLGPERVLFGTEYPLQHPSVELAKYAALELTEADWALVAWRNAHRILGEEIQ